MNENHNKKVNKIKPTARKNPEIGIDDTGKLVNDIVECAINSTLNVSKLEGFTSVAQTREQMYRLIDDMSQDPTISAVLETYAEDATETSDTGRIVWCESSDSNVSQYVTYLLDKINVDKHIYGWTYSLCKWGDLYLRLYRQSDYDDDTIFNEKKEDRKLNENIESDNVLKENVNVSVINNNDHYSNYLEAVPNPGSMFELDKFGKIYGYANAPYSIMSTDENSVNQFLQYRMKQSDVTIYPATEFVHASLEDNSSRTPEEVSLFLNDDDYANNKNSYNYKVKRGQPLLYNTYKVWRQLTLLESSVLLNRVTKSSIVRMISVEVGDMPKEQIGAHLQKIKSLIEQKASLKEGGYMSEYSNSGPIENNIYIPTHGGVGSISTQQIGGDVDPKQLTDLSYFQDKMFGSMRVPKQFFGLTDDGAGFNGGQSLSIISSRYGKAIKRIQNTMVQCLTDAINLMLIDRGLTSYVNKFTIKMLAPITQEELDRRENVTNRLRVVSDTMNTLSDIEDKPTRLKILKSLLSTTNQDPEVLALIQQQIDAFEKEEEEGEEEDTETSEAPERHIELSKDDLNTEDEEPYEENEEEPSEEPNEESEQPEEPSEQPEENEQQEEQGGEESGHESYLPSPEELNIDLTK